MKNSSRVALVSGANRGIGLEIVRQLARLGLKVVLGSRDRESGEAAAAEVGSGVVAVPIDVCDASNVEPAVRAIVERFGAIDVVVNNAGILIDTGKTAATIDLEAVRETIETNVLGAWRLSQTAIPYMHKAGYGRIVNVTSGMGTLGDLEASGGSYPAYRLSKAAMNALTILLASELRGENILVNAVHPGWVRTRMGGSGAPRSIEEGADTPVWLATLPDGGPSGRLFEDRRERHW